MERPRGDGKRAREWWFWSLPSADPTRRVRLPAASAASPRQLAERRALLQQTLVDLGADETEARGLAQHVLEYIDSPAATRRVVCGDRVCVGPGRAVERKEAAERKRQIKEYQAAVARYKKAVRPWEYTPLRCNDGTRSPSCVCGGNWRGCCSWHDGVDGCPREEPTPPDPPPGVADALE